MMGEIMGCMSGELSTKLQPSEQKHNCLPQNQQQGLFSSDNLMKEEKEEEETTRKKGVFLQTNDKYFPIRYFFILNSGLTLSNKCLVVCLYFREQNQVCLILTK
ncbi:hypothetical protein XENORESO_015277 [Xenotaenia resolanae]|uniref:Uncharacterized protein n=1 Tax=Xenotaenia resolanae TaxID=208358 RepID=A0ABV0VZ63_9TELE